MKRPRFRTTVRRAPAMARPDQLPVLRKQFEEHCPMRATNSEPESVEVVTGFDGVYGEYSLNSGTLECGRKGSFPLANSYWTNCLDQQDRDAWRQVLLEIHRARCALARENLAVQEQAENLIRLTDKNNIDTLAELILDSIQIARADVKAFAKKWLIDRGVEP